MPESTENAEITAANATQGETAEKERTFTQAEMDAIIGDRLKRERAKYADYDELAAKAKAYDEAAEAGKSELQKAVEERDRLKAEVEKFKADKERAEAVARAASEHKVDAELLSRMSGDVEENAKFLATVFPGAEVTMVPGSEHALPIMIPEEIDAAVADIALQI